MLNWLKLGALGIAAAAVLGYGWYCETKKAELASFTAEVAALGRAAEQDASDAIKEALANKERTNAQNSALRRSNAALARSLRNERASRSILPPAAPTAKRPDRATFDRAELERAIRQLDAGVSGLVEQGDAARIDLDSAKAWAQNETD